MKFRKSSLLVKLVVLIIIVYSTVTLVSLNNQLQDKRAEAAVLTEEAQQLQQENIDLQERIDNLSTDEGIEEVARNKLGLVKDGEIVFYDNGD